MNTPIDEATPRPWKFDQANNGLIAFRIAGNGFILADVFFKNTSEYAVSRDEAEANAALIVQAVNQYAALKAVAEAAEELKKLTRKHFPHRSPEWVYSNPDDHLHQSDEEYAPAMNRFLDALKVYTESKGVA